jgi:hypothetical protein
MPAVPRHAKHKAPATSSRKPAPRRGAFVVAAVTLAGAAAVFVSLHGGSAAPKSAQDAVSATSARSVVIDDQMAAAVRSNTAALQNKLVIHRARRTVRRRHLAALAAARLARRQAAEQKAREAKARQAAAKAPPPSPTPTPTPSSGGGGDAAHSALGDCIRNAEEGGSYEWGPGNGGGAYQFAIGTWENYGGAAGEFGVAGAAYQDQIFDNAIAAGGASNWTNYDGC